MTLYEFSSEKDLLHIKMGDSNAGLEIYDGEIYFQEEEIKSIYLFKINREYGTNTLALCINPTTVKVQEMLEKGHILESKWEAK